MSGKFMNIKRIIIPTLTLVCIASQLMGCSAATQDELLTMLNNGDAIEIEVAAPLAENEQGEESSILWEELASLTTTPDLRSEWDDILGITKTETGKNGVLYVNTEGENENNNTLRVALHNREFLKFLEDESSISELSTAVQNNYADLEVDEEMKSVYMGINGYFNLLPDATPNYSNPDSTLTRAEFMAMVMRAETPVQDITADTKFTNTVGNSDYNIYAQEVAVDSYLDLSSKSLNNMTYNGTITRAEAIYLLMNHYFSDELKNVDISKATFSDAKDGGNIAVEQKFIENATQKDYWKSYELTYAIQNAQQGLPTDLYKALVLAEQKGLITDETRWDEGITKAESVEFLINTIQLDTSIPLFSAKQGTIEGYEVEEETTEENTGGSMTGGSIELDDWEKEALKEAEEAEAEMPEATTSTIEIVEELDKTMYGIKNGNIRNGDSTDYDIVASLEYGATIHVTGKTANGWYRIQWGDTDAYCASSLLADSMPSDSGNTSEIPQQPSTPSQPEQPTQPSTPPSSGGGTGSSQTIGSQDTYGGTVGDPNVWDNIQW